MKPQPLTDEVWAKGRKMIEQLWEACAKHQPKGGDDLGAVALVAVEAIRRLDAAEEKSAGLEREAKAYAEALDNVREAIGVEQTHYFVIHDEVREKLDAALAAKERAEKALREVAEMAMEQGNLGRIFDETIDIAPGRPSPRRPPPRRRADEVAEEGSRDDVWLVGGCGRPATMRMRLARLHAARPDPHPSGPQAPGEEEGEGEEVSDVKLKTTQEQRDMARHVYSCASDKHKAACDDVDTLLALLAARAGEVERLRGLLAETLSAIHVGAWPVLIEATDEEIRAIMEPLCKALVRDFGVKGANRRLKQAAKAAGLDPTQWSIAEGKWLS